MGILKKSDEKNLEGPDEHEKLSSRPIDASTTSFSISSDSTGDNEKDLDGSQRGTWKGKMDFILSLIGYAVGLGNIWRFPYLCYKSGGGAFLIPYIIFMLLCGMPLFFLEITYGQFASLSPVTIWSISPLFKGVGYGMVIISGIVCIYYNIIIAWTLYYLFMSMQTTLPWSSCDNEWNTENCAEIGSANSSAWASSSMYSNFSGFGDYNVSALSLVSNITSNITKIPPSEEFWQRQVLQITEGIENIGGIRWELFGCLILSWIIVFLCICRGVQSSGRVVYVTATFPYLILLILFVRGVTLPGAMNGLRFYLIPDWSKLLKFQVWADAAVQIFYSMGMAWGGLITMASYNKFNNNIYRDAILVPLMNSGTSVFAGFVIFSVLGFMAHESGVDISEVATQGPGLAFVAYPAAIARLPISPLWAVLFFLMLLTVGLDTQVTFVFWFVFLLFFAFLFIWGFSHQLTVLVGNNIRFMSN